MLLKSFIDLFCRRTFTANFLIFALFSLFLGCSKMSCTKDEGMHKESNFQNLIKKMNDLNINCNEIKSKYDTLVINESKATPLPLRSNVTANEVIELLSLYPRFSEEQSEVIRTFFNIKDVTHEEVYDYFSFTSKDCNYFYYSAVWGSILNSKLIEKSEIKEVFKEEIILNKNDRLNNFLSLTLRTNFIRKAIHAKLFSISEEGENSLETLIEQLKNEKKNFETKFSKLVDGPLVDINPKAISELELKNMELKKLKQKNTFKPNVVREVLKEEWSASQELARKLEDWAKKYLALQEK